MTKDALRAAALEARKAMAPGEYLENSRRVTELFFATQDLSFIRVLHTFLPVTGRKEPDIWPLIERVRREFPHITIAIPKMTGNLLEHYRFEGLHQLKENKFGIAEPAGGTTLLPETFDLVLVPLLVADRSGNRIGYGKGYYDRFLAGCRPECKTIGVSLAAPVESVPAEAHDVPLSGLLTPSEVFNFG